MRGVDGASGGVDSSVAARLISEAIGDKLTCIFVDNGVLRQGEAEMVMAMYAGHFNMKVIKVDASELFFPSSKASPIRSRNGKSSGRRSSRCS